MRVRVIGPRHELDQWEWSTAGREGDLVEVGSGQSWVELDDGELPRHGWIKNDDLVPLDDEASAAFAAHALGSE